MKTIYNIVYATDDTFAPVLGTSLLSLLRNNKEAKKINLFWIVVLVKRINLE